MPGIGGKDRVNSPIEILCYERYTRRTNVRQLSQRKLDSVLERSNLTVDYTPLEPLTDNIGEMAMNRSFWTMLMIVMLAFAVWPSVATASECAWSEPTTAYITGGMNIRASASISSRVVASARAGDSFTVLESRAGARWCWLRISLGWMADTSRVQATSPVQGVATPSIGAAAGAALEYRQLLFRRPTVHDGEGMERRLLGLPK